MTRTKLEIEEGEEVVRCTIVGVALRPKPTKSCVCPLVSRSCSVEPPQTRPFATVSSTSARPPWCLSLPRPTDLSLLHEREATLQQPEVGLLDSEKTIVRSVPAATLSTMIDQIDLPRHGRKRFLRTVAACNLPRIQRQSHSTVYAHSPARIHAHRT
jgi:hypothetical protein